MTKESHASSPSNPTGKNTSVEKRIKLKKAKMGKISMITMGGLGVHEFIKSSKDGDSTTEAVMNSAGIMAAGYMVNPIALAGGMVATEGVKQAYKVGKTAIEKTQQINRMGTGGPFSNNNFVETRDSFTMRQVSMAAINQARGNLENSMMGNEASFNHR